MYNIDVEAILRYTLILLRIGGLLFTLPFFSESVIPVRLRIVLSFVLAFCFFPIISDGWRFSRDYSVMNIFWCLLSELLVGMSLGYVAKLFFEGIVMAANLVGYQMGFGTASLLLPGSDTEISSFTALHRIVVMLVFLGLSFHYIFIHGIKMTFDYIPAGGFAFNLDFCAYLVKSTGMIFEIALQLAAPILMALLFTMAALGLIARTVPQVNVFVLSFPFSFFIGLSLYAITLVYLPDWLSKFYKQTAIDFLGSIKSLVP